MRRRAALGLFLLPSVASAAPEAESRNVVILDRLGRIDENMTESVYHHATVVDEKRGFYQFDCSGMLNWVLRRSAPGAYGSVKARSAKGRALARDYYWELQKTRPGNAAPRGWRRVSRVDEAEPGDVIAWLKPARIKSPNTGHCAFLLEAPRPTQAVPGGFLVRIADSTRYRHDDDDRSVSGRSGFGSGTILIVAGDDGEPVAYGWVGLRGWLLEASIAIGRPVR
jgi:hypothetical protein